MSPVWLTVVFLAGRSDLFAGPYGQSRLADLEPTLTAIQETIEAGDLEAALRSIATALDQHPNQAGLLNLRGVVYAKEQNLTAARADFERAVQLDPRLAPAWQNLGRACQILASADNSAIACAISSWNRVLRQRPDDSEAHISLATLDLWSGKFTDSLQQLSALRPTESAPASVLALRCADLAGLHRWEQAKEAALRLAHVPDFTDDDAATVFPVLKSAQSANLVVTLVETLDGRNAASVSSLSHLAVAYEHEGNLAKAKDAYEKALKIDTSSPAPTR